MQSQMVDSEINPKRMRKKNYRSKLIPLQNIYSLGWNIFLAGVVYLMIDYIIYIVVFQCLLEFVGCIENINTSRTDSRTDARGGRVKYCIKRQLENCVSCKNC